MIRVRWLAGAPVGLGLLACMAGSSPDPTTVASPPRGKWDDGFAGDVPMDLAQEEGAAMPAPSPSPSPGYGALGGLANAKPAQGARGPSSPVTAEPTEAAPEASEAAVRTWFPEAFVWQPLVETDGDGLAEVELRVPDQLTTWRVLALAHDRAGHQSGAVHTFDSTLPAYVDPVIPGWMYVGDALVVPVQVMSNVATGTSGSLVVTGRGAIDGGTAGQIALGGFGSAVQPALIEASRVGEATLEASLGGVDAVIRTWPVHPVGLPEVGQRGGTLTGSRTVPLTWPADADPRTANLAIAVHPGPLAVLGAELERLGTGATGAYAFGLAHHLQALSAAAGVEVDDGVLRTTRIRAWQRVVRQARSPSAPDAADLLLALGPSDGDALVDGLRARLARVVIDGQRGDGTWVRQDQGTLQRVIVQTAVAAWSLPEDAVGPRLRAQGAIERFQPEIDDPYTAAVVLATGPSPDPDRLRKLVIDGLVEVDGRRTVAVPADTASVWSVGPPSRQEMLAWTALALQPTEPDLAGDLVSELMTAYSAEWGFGLGPADVVALRAVVGALPTVDVPVRLTLALNGQEVATGVVDPAQPKVPAVLLATPASLAPGELTLSAEPATAGLSWVLTQRSWTPWRGTERLPGVEVEVAQQPLVAGEDGVITLTLAAPSGASVRVVQGLPPGTSVDAEGIPQGRLSSVDVTQDRVTLVTQPFLAGEILEIRIPVRPTYAGRMVTRPLEVSSAGRSAMLAPHVWTVARP